LVDEPKAATKRMLHEAKMASENARKMATNIKAITIRPVSNSNKGES